MLNIFGILIVALLSTPSYAKVCGSLFTTEAVPFKQFKSLNPSIHYTGYAKPITNSGSSVNLRPLYVNLKKSNRTKLEITYGDIIYGGYQIRQLTLSNKSLDRNGNTVLTYSYAKNGIEFVTLKVSESNSKGQNIIFYQLNLKSEVTTPSNTERVYQFNSQDS